MSPEWIIRPGEKLIRPSATNKPPSGILGKLGSTVESGKTHLRWRIWGFPPCCWPWSWPCWPPRFGWGGVAGRERKTGHFFLKKEKNFFITFTSFTFLFLFFFSLTVFSLELLKLLKQYVTKVAVIFHIPVDKLARESFPFLIHLSLLLSFAGRANNEYDHPAYYALTITVLCFTILRCLEYRAWRPVTPLHPQCF